MGGMLGGGGGVHGWNAVGRGWSAWVECCGVGVECMGGTDDRPYRRNLFNASHQQEGPASRR